MHGTETASLGWPMVTVGGFFLAGFVAHVMGSRSHVPRVTLLLILGLLAGPSAMDLIPSSVSLWFPVAAQLALSIVGFGLGEQFLGAELRKSGKSVLLIALGESVMVAVMVGGLLALAGVPLPACLLLAGVAPATDAAATVDVIRESGARGPVTQTVLGIAAVDDAYCIMIFSLLLTAAEYLAGSSGGGSLLHGLWEIGAAVILGGTIGLPMAWLTGRARPGSLTLIETLGFVSIASGLAVVLGVSYLLTNITLGATVANFARHHTRPFHAISGVTEPFLVIFFLLAGFKLELGGIASIGGVAVLYVVGRVVGKLFGAYLGAKWSRSHALVRTHVGFCLLPQAGVAIGLALLGMERMGPGHFDILALLVATTFFFEIVGPVTTQRALLHAGEIASAR